MAIRRKAITL